MSEVWKTVPGYDGLYEVSDMGRVRSLRYGKIRILSQYFDRKGYKRVQLSCKSKKVHRLVALAFIPNLNNLPMVNHKDEDKANNVVSNLEWCTNLYNIRYGTAIDRISKKKQVSVIATNDNGDEFLYPSIVEAARLTGCKAQCISQCCRRVMGRVSVGGYRWRYADNEKHDFYTERYRKRIKSRAVVAIDKNGNEFCFSSIKEGVEKIGASRSAIIRSCKTHYHSMGYKWKYV